MIKELKNYILSYLRTIYLFESTKNKKKLNFKGFKLVTFRKFQSIKDQNLKNLLNKEKRKRFKDKQLFLVLYFNNDVVTTGWMLQGTKWHVSEIGKEIGIKNKILLYDFFTSESKRNRGYYAKILKLIKNYNTKKKFWIYCLSNNYSSKKGIENSNFKLFKIIKK
tara:strand:+ start:961 stop:1455 length:495 start_codon:yes stop_codon:yes gene_type:complete